MRSEDGIARMNVPERSTPEIAAETPPGGGAPGAAQTPAVIGLGGGDDSTLRIQLAARWAERFAPEHGDSLAASLERFRRAFEYLDAVTHGIEPQPFGE